MALFLISGCDLVDPAGQTGPVQEEAGILGDQLRSAPTAEGELLTIQLAFAADVDLDLYVTGPLLETVYFANHESKSGGKISDDVRCDSEESGTRTEKVIYLNPMKGRYRIGVDFPHRCSGESGPAPFAVLVERPGEDLQKEGSVKLERFEVAVLEFEL